MERTAYKTGKPVDIPAVDAFVDDIMAVYNKHQMSIGHEDEGGAMIIEPISSANIHWLDSAFVNVNAT